MSSLTNTSKSLKREQRVASCLALAKGLDDDELVDLMDGLGGLDFDIRVAQARCQRIIAESRRAQFSVVANE